MAAKEKPTREQVTKVANEIERFVLSDKVQRAMAGISEDGALAEAKRDPSGFLKKRGVAVPSGYRIRITGTVTICITVCGTIGGVRICVQVCGTIRF
ncbi:MAG TPA: hypothetical protein VIM36_14560 [Gemmatimonadaceae bacterium]|jgi:hypothetical protein